jgi:diacylglycerol kinase family enzyme
MIDIGKAQPAEQSPHRASRHPSQPASKHIPLQKQAYFAHAFTIGLNVQFARLATNVATRRRYGQLTYPVAALEVLRNHTALDVQIEFEGLAILPTTYYSHQQEPAAPILVEKPVTLQCRALQAAIINAPNFGGQWQLSVPGASLSDHLFDVVIVEDIDLSTLGMAFTHLFNQQNHNTDPASGWHAQYPELYAAELTHIPGVHHVQAHGVTIRTNTDPQDATLDGEVRGQTPIVVHMADERLPVLVPQEPATS